MPRRELHTITVRSLEFEGMTAFQATCSCGWSWSNRFYREHAADDGARHQQQNQKVVKRGSRADH